jgi:hypothetical protein
MIRVELRTPKFDDQAVAWERLAVLEAEGNELTWIEGDPEILDLSVPALDLRNNRRVTVQEDAEAWVRGLSTIFRSGEITVSVVEDTNPIAADGAQAPDDGDAPMDIHEPAWRLHA